MRRASSPSSPLSARKTRPRSIGRASPTGTPRSLSIWDWPPRPPCAVLARGTRADSQAAVGRLEELDALAAEVGEGPAILVIGEVAARSAPWRAAQVDAVSA